VSYQDFDDDKPEESFLKRNRIPIAMGIAFFAIVGTSIPLIIKYARIPPPRKPQEIVIHLQPLPPLPPPPPPPRLPPPPPSQPKFVEQPKDLKPLEKNEPKNPDRPPGPSSPPANGPPSDFGLGGPGGGYYGDGGGGGSKYGVYASEVQTRVAEALRKNDKTKDARLRVKVRIWVNSSGSITRAALAGSSGDPSLDDAVKNQVLTGLNLSEAPPTDMPMPIVMMITEQRPN